MILYFKDSTPMGIKNHFKQKFRRVGQLSLVCLLDKLHVVYDRGHVGWLTADNMNYLCKQSKCRCAGMAYFEASLANC